MERWGDLDRTTDPTSFVRYLDAVSAQQATAAYKERTFALLAPRDGNSMLEVGCGNGDDARALATHIAPTGRVTAIDVSETMVAEARARGAVGVDFETGDGQALRFSDATFDGVRVDRTLQHVLDPALVIREMARVLLPGGRLVAAEPDWDTLLLSATDHSLTRRIVSHKTDRDHRNGTIGRRLAGLIVEAGLAPVAVEAAALALNDLEQAMRLAGLRESALSAARGRAITTAEAKEWLADLERQGARGTLVLTITLVIVAAEKR